jgi:hypothetical protein
MMVVPHPTAVADAVIKRIGRTNMHAHSADMGACGDTAWSRAGSRARTTDLYAGADLGVRGACEDNHGGKYRSSQRFHFRSSSGGTRRPDVQSMNGWNKEFRSPPKMGCG